MPAQPNPQFLLDQAVLGQLACPACLGALRQDGAHLACAGCGRAYPVVDGIPVLIAERAVPATPSQNPIDSAKEY
jgi:uncharacterized protein YbaR (Trm112 family)